MDGERVNQLVEDPIPPSANLNNYDGVAEVRNGRTSESSFAATTRRAYDARCRAGEFKDLETSRCVKCPKGTYGELDGLVGRESCLDCPAGTYSDIQGSARESDCRKCPEGTWGESTGLSTPKCSGSCAPGYYSRVLGATDAETCVRCPPGYFQSQCARPNQEPKGRRRHTMGYKSRASYRVN